MSFKVKGSENKARARFEEILVGVHSRCVVHLFLNYEEPIGSPFFGREPAPRLLPKKPPISFVGGSFFAWCALFVFSSEDSR